MHFWSTFEHGMHQPSAARHFLTMAAVLAWMVCPYPLWAQTDAALPRFPTLEEIQRAAKPELKKGEVAAPAVPAATLALPQQAQARSASPTVTLPSAIQPRTPMAATPTREEARSEYTARLMALLKQHGAAPSLPVSVLRGGLYVAISFSMPEETIRRLVYQATAAGGRVLLRGFDGSPKRTRDRLMKIIGETSVSAAQGGKPPGGASMPPAGLEHMSVRIAPKLFERFDIREVPAFVLISPPGARDDCVDQTCAAYKDFVAIYGDVTVPHALESIGRMRPSFRASAEYFGKRPSSYPAQIKGQR